jgi:hypothetical protein
MSDRDDAIGTRVAWAGWHEHQYYGHRVFAELAGSETYAGLMAIAVGAPRLAPEERWVLEDICAVLTVAEPRIWPNKVSRLVASYGRVIPATLAGCLCFESELIGPWTTGQTAQNLVELAHALGEDRSEKAIEGAVIELLDRRKRLLGFGVPFRPKDERLVALTACIARRGRDGRLYWNLSERVWEVLRRLKGLEPNIGSGVAAAMLDLGLSPEQIPPLTIGLNLNIFLANAFEGARQAPEVLRRLPERLVEYVGPPDRLSPRATEP